MDSYDHETCYERQNGRDQSDKHALGNYHGCLIYRPVPAVVFTATGTCSTMWMP